MPIACVDVPVLSSSKDVRAYEAWACLWKTTLARNPVILNLCLCLTRSFQAIRSNYCLSHTHSIMYTRVHTYAHTRTQTHPHYDKQEKSTRLERIVGPFETSTTEDDWSVQPHLSPTTPQPHPLNTSV